MKYRLSTRPSVDRDGNTFAVATWAGTLNFPATPTEPKEWVVAQNAPFSPELQAEIATYNSTPRPPGDPGKPQRRWRPDIGQLPRIVRNVRRGKNHEQWQAMGWRWSERWRCWYLRERMTAAQRREQQSVVERLTNPNLF